MAELNEGLAIHSERMREQGFQEEANDFSNKYFEISGCRPEHRKEYLAELKLLFDQAVGRVSKADESQ